MQIFRAPESLKTLIFLDDRRAHQFNYTLGDACDVFANDEQCLKTLHEMASVLMMSSNNVIDMLALMAGILYLGQLQFTAEGSAIAIVNSRTDPLHHPAPHLDIDAVALMLGLSTSAVTIALTSRTITVEGRLIEVPLCAGKAAPARDAIAKEIYSRLFQWIVSAANARTCTRLAGTSLGKDHSISVLDIFGFESFEHNYFEQLCINYANEKLQAKFSADMIASVQAEYELQGVPWSKVSFVDNSEVVSLIEGRRGLIDLFNEVCMLPTGSDALILSRLKTAYFDKHHPVCLSTLRREPSFCIAHYAGRVSYHVAGFIDKNRDAILPQVSSLLATSSNSLLAEIFAEKTIDCSVRSRTSMHSPTIFSKFKSQLHSLMADIESTKTLYVRCIKPNSSKSSEEFNRATVVDQLRSGGMTEAVRVGRSAYPQKIPIHDFLTQFTMLSLRKRECRIDPRDHCTHLLQEITAGSTVVGELRYEVGITVIYFADGVLEYLERKKAARIKESSEILGCFINSSIIRRRYMRVRQKATAIQAFVRRWAIAMQLSRWRKASNKIKNAFLRWKVVKQQQQHRIQIAAATRTVKQWFLRQRALRRGIERKSAAAKLQGWFRGVLLTSRQMTTGMEIKSRETVGITRDLQIELQQSITDKDHALQSSRDLQIELQRFIVDCCTVLRTVVCTDHGWSYSAGKWVVELGRDAEAGTEFNCAYEKIIITALLLIVLIVHG